MICNYSICVYFGVRNQTYPDEKEGNANSCHFCTNGLGWRVAPKQRAAACTRNRHLIVKVDQSSRGLFPLNYYNSSPSKMMVGRLSFPLEIVLFQRILRKYGSFLTLWHLVQHLLSFRWKDIGETTQAHCHHGITTSSLRNSPTVEETVHMTCSVRYPPVNKHSNGKSPSWIGNTSSNGGFSIAMLDYWSVPLSMHVFMRTSKLMYHPQADFTSHQAITSHESESNCRRFPMIHHVEEKLCMHWISEQNMQNAWVTQLQWTSRSRMAPMVPLHHRPCGSCWRFISPHTSIFFKVSWVISTGWRGPPRNGSKPLVFLGVLRRMLASIYFFLILCI